MQPNADNGLRKKSNADTEEARKEQTRHTAYVHMQART